MESYSVLMSSMDELGGEDNNDSDDQLSEFLMDDLECKRVSTAPAKPLSDMGRFKREKQFTILEQFVITANQMIHKAYEKYDLDSEEGQKIFKRYLMHIESLCEHYKVETNSRSYRQSFSSAYKVLYKEGSLCYLTQIWDSAQQAFPYLWVNGEKFIFSGQVLQTGTRLVSEHFKLQHILKNSYSKICQQTSESLESIRKEISSALLDFDTVWTRYQHTYITELMNIEKEARKLIVKSIELEHMLSSIEVRERLKGRLPTKIQEYRNIRNQLIQILCNINAVANSKGKGRDDLDHQILEQAEGIIRRVTEQQSQGVRLLAQKIRSSFNKFRHLLRRYENNIELVDPQLRENPDLVELLLEYQNSWEKGKNYFQVPLKCKFLIHFSYIIEMTSEKYPDFREQLEALDVSLFLSIPCLLVLKSLDNEDKQMCQFFLPYLLQDTTKTHKLYKSLNEDFAEWKAISPDNFAYCNVIQKELIGAACSQTEAALKTQYKGFNEMLNKIKCISMEMQRCCPIEWNSLLDAALSLPSN